MKTSGHESNALRFFRDLNGDERSKVFGVFGVAPQILEEVRSHSSERKLFDHLFAALFAPSAPEPRVTPAMVDGMRDSLAELTEIGEGIKALKMELDAVPEPTQEALTDAKVIEAAKEAWPTLPFGWWNDDSNGVRTAVFNFARNIERALLASQPAAPVDEHEQFCDDYGRIILSPADVVAQPATPITVQDDAVEARTEKIRLSHANADSKGKIQLRHEVECLLWHIALLKSVDPHAVQGDAVREAVEPDLYDEIYCDLPYLFARASKEGHEFGQQLAMEVRLKMEEARALKSTQPSAAPAGERFNAATCEQIAAIKLTEAIVKAQQDAHGEQWVTVRILAGGDAENTAAEAVHHALQFVFDNKPGLITAWSDAAPVEAAAAWQDYNHNEGDGLAGRIQAAQGQDGPVAYMFNVRYIGKGKGSEFAAIDHIVQAGEEILSKRPLVYADAHPPVLALTDANRKTLARVVACLEILEKRPRPMCRDCGDENGICPHSGLDCGMQALISESRAILKAAEGVKA